MPPIWERQIDEPSRSYFAFTIYRDMGPARSLDRAYRKQRLSESGGVSGRWSAWCTEWKWVERAAAYDAHMEAEKTKAFEGRMRELGRRRAEYEYHHQARLEELVDRMDAVLKKAEAAPITDVTRKEDTETGQITTKVKGISLSGFARLIGELRDTAEQAVTGVREDKGEETQQQSIVKGEFVWVPPKDDSEEK